MGYQMKNGRWADTEDIELAASAVRTANGTGTALELGDRAAVRLDLAVTAASGTTPTLDIAIETSKDGSTGWAQIGALTQVTATGTQRRRLVGCDRFVRATWTVGGTTPSFAFSLTGEAV